MDDSSLQGWRSALGAPAYELASAYVDLVESGLQEAAGRCGPLSEVACYVIAAGGRRIRPLVTLAMCEALGGNCARARGLAVAVELVHTASLIHDDILDGSEQRRGLRAAHLHFNTKLAVLTGDMLCFTALTGASALPGAADVLAAACRAMCIGEVTEDPLDSARLKTGALFRAAAELGAMAAAATDDLLRSAGRYGEKLGTAFQLRDDQLDGDANAPPDAYAKEARAAIAHVPDSPAKKLLVQLTRFACQRSR